MNEVRPILSSDRNVAHKCTF